MGERWPVCCPGCAGEGVIENYSCQQCGGKGSVEVVNASLLSDLADELEKRAEDETRPHDSYADCLNGGYRGYQAACWDCEWRGAEHLRGSEEMGTPESRAHKMKAQDEGVHHRETARPLIDKSEAAKAFREAAHLLRSASTSGGEE